MASPMELLCWKSLSNDTIWNQEIPGNCSYSGSITKELMFVLLSHALLALVSALYIYLDLMDERPTGTPIMKTSTTLHVRLVIAVSSALVPASSLLLEQVTGLSRSDPADVLGDGTSSVAWLLLSLYLWKLRRRHGIQLVRAHGPLMFVWALTFLSQCVRLSIVTEQLLSDDGPLAFWQQKGKLLAISMLQVMYLLTLSPLPRHAAVYDSGDPSASPSVSNGIGVDNTKDQLEASSGKPSDTSHDLGIAADNTSLLSKLTFGWTQEIMRKGVKGQLKKASDVFKLPEKLTSGYAENFISHFYPQGSVAFAEDVFAPEESTSNRSSPKINDSPVRNRFSSAQSSSMKQEEHTTPEGFLKDKPERVSLHYAFARAFGAKNVLLGILRFLSNLCMFASPLLLSRLLSYLEDSREETRNGYFYALGLCISTFLLAVFNSQYEYHMMQLKMQLLATVTTTLYRKTLAVGARALSTFTTGQIINMINVDAWRIAHVSSCLHDAWSVILEIIVTLYLLYQQVGSSFIIGVGIALLIMPISKYIMAKIIRYHRKLMKQKDARVKMMHEILNGIRVIKFYAWERHFKKQINDLRSEELGSLKGIKYFCALNDCVCSTSPILIALCTFTSYTLLGNELTAAKVFTSLALFSMLNGPITGVPWVLNCLLEGWVSFKRIQKFMDLEQTDLATYYLSGNESSDKEALRISRGTFYWEHPKKSEDGKEDEEGKHDDKKKSKEKKSKGGAKEDKGGDTKEHHDLVKLQEIDLNVTKGQLVGVIGKVGSGKTSLLSSILADMVKEEGSISVAGLGQGFGVATQEPWLQHATVKDNILFGRPYDAERYHRVVEACALLDDLKILPAGDETEIGEKGITLSGGQKARVALARAVYQDSEVYLLDDPLAAVDAQVGQHIFSKCIMGLLANTTRILCTHHTRFLVDADLVVVMEDFKIVNQGLPCEVFNDPQYASHLKYSKLDTEVEDEKPIESEVKGQGGQGKKLVDEEEKKEGVVKFEVYKWYWNAIGSTLASGIFLAFILMQVTTNLSDWWLSHWVSHTREDTNHTMDLPIPDQTISFTPTTQPINISQDLESQGYWSPNVFHTEHSTSSSSMYYLKVYAGVIAINSVFNVLKTFLFTYGVIHAATVIHDGLLNSIFKAPISFFDATPVGRIISRFTSDVFEIDFDMTFGIHHLIHVVLCFIGAVLLTCYSLPWFILCLIPLGAICYAMQDYYRKTSRELRRITSISRSAICSHFSETLAGLTVIKGMRETKRFRLENRAKLDLSLRAWLSTDAVSRWLFFRLQMIGVVMVTLVAIIALLEHQYETADAGLVGLAITYALANTHRLIAVINTLTEIEKQMISTERVHHYTTAIPNEPQGALVKVASLWPQRGVVKFSNVQFSYREDHPKALSGVDFETRPGEKVGIVGRTGSGKSTLFLVLFRMVQIQAGSVTIDGVDLAELSLEDVRSRLAIIPQDPFLFSGSVKKNLDPVGQFSDSELWCVLKKCHIKDVVRRMGGLEASAGEGGKQFSTGQKQLVCLARAMLTKAKVLCIDEATASVDMATDDLLQQAIKEEFQDNTILTIAHRLNTLRDSDRILVMEGGRVAKFEKTNVTTVDNVVISDI